MPPTLTEWKLEATWPWPPWATLLFVVFAAVFVAATCLRARGVSLRCRWTLAGLRAAAIALLLLMIARLALVVERIGPPDLAMLVDDSRSMTIADASGRSRWDQVQAFLNDHDARLLRRLDAKYALRLHYLSDILHELRGGPAKLAENVCRRRAECQKTALGAGVQAVLGNSRCTAPAAIVVLSDGVNTEGPSTAEAAETAHRRGVPIYFIGFGGRRPARDVKIIDLTSDETAFVGDALRFECRLSAKGIDAGQKIGITVREKGKPAVLARTEVAAAGPDGRPQTVRLWVHPAEAGRFEYVVEAAAQPGEVSLENNRASRVVRVHKDKIRVLLVDGRPRFEFRYLRNMLQREPSIALDTVLQDADPDHAAQDAAARRAFPSRREELFAYDAVILGDADPEQLGRAAMRNLAEFVDRPSKGGTLILIAGASSMPASYRGTPLAPLLPFPADKIPSPKADSVLSEGFIVEPTGVGMAWPGMQLGDSPASSLEIWRRLAPVYWLLESPDLKPGVRVLAEHPTRVGQDGRRLPVFFLQYVGAGKVLFHATDETWRWRYRVGDVYFARYWVQALRGLCRPAMGSDRRIVLTTDRREYAVGDSVRLRAAFADNRFAPADNDGVTIVVEAAGRKTERIRLRRTGVDRGVFQGVVERPAAGDYHAWIASPTLEGKLPTADFTVVAPPGEFAETQMDAVEMRRAASRSGGRFYEYGDETAQKLLDALPAGRPTSVETLPPLSLWNRWPVLAAFLGLLAAEWIVRKRRGMV